MSYTSVFVRNHVIIIKNYVKISCVTFEHNITMPFIEMYLDLIDLSPNKALFFMILKYV